MSLVLSVEMLSIILFAVVRVLWVENIILIALAAKKRIIVTEDDSIKLKLYHFD